MKIRRAIYFVAGVAVGYVAGSAAGRERYEAIVGHVSGVASKAGLPEFGTKVADRSVDVARSATDAAGTIVDVAADKAGDLVDAAADKVTGTVEEVSKSKKSTGKS